MESFTENPFVQAIGMHLGLSGLMGADPSGGDPSTPQTPPPSPVPNTVMKAGKSTVPGSTENREFRQHAPVAKATNGRGLSPDGRGAGMNLPGVMDPQTLMHPMVQQLLGQYGITPEQLQSTVNGANPNLFIDNQQAFQRHPVLSNMIERGLEGVAFTKPSNTIGEGINNVAQGILNAKAARADKYNNQLMMPFGQAQQVANLKGVSDEQNFKQAQAKHYQDLEDHYNAMDQMKQDLGQQSLDLKKGTQKLQTQAQNLKLMGDIQKTPFNDEENTSYQKLIQDANGNPLEVDPAALQTLVNTASQRKIDADRQNKIDVQKTANIGRIGAANANSGNRPNSLPFQDYKTQYATAVKALQTFDKGGADFQSVDESGTHLVPGSQKFKDYRTKLSSEVDRVKGLMDQATQPQTRPDVMPSKKPTGRIKTYHQDTGRIE